MKRIYSILLILALVLALTACGKKEGTAQSGGKPSFWNDDTSTTPTASSDAVEPDWEKLAVQCLEDLIRAESAEAAKAFLTEDSWDNAQNLLDYYPDEVPEVKMQFKAQNGEYDICRYTLYFPSNEDPFEVGYVVLHREEDVYRLCVNQQVQSTVLSHYLCDKCGGAGSVTTGNPISCAICGGTGTQYIPNAYYDAGMNMWMGQYMGCSGCGGSGYIGGTNTSVCDVCSGECIVFP